MIFVALFSAPDSLAFFLRLGLNKTLASDRTLSRSTGLRYFQKKEDSFFFETRNKIGSIRVVSRTVTRTGDTRHQRAGKNVFAPLVRKRDGVGGLVEASRPRSISLHPRWRARFFRAHEKKKKKKRGLEKRKNFYTACFVSRCWPLRSVQPFFLQAVGEFIVLCFDF